MYEDDRFSVLPKALTRNSSRYIFAPVGAVITLLSESRTWICRYYRNGREFRFVAYGTAWTMIWSQD